MGDLETAEVQRALGRIETGLSGSRDWQNAHQSVDDRQFEELRQEMRSHFATLGPRITRLEMIADGLEGHGAALVDLEKRMTEAEETHRIDAAIRAQNAIWIRWTFFVVAAIAAAVYAPHLMSLVTAIAGIMK